MKEPLAVRKHPGEVNDQTINTESFTMNIVKAKRAIVLIGDGINLEALMMPSGEFRLTITSAANAVGLTQAWLSNVISGRRPTALKSLQDKGFDCISGIVPVVIDDPLMRKNLKAKTIDLDNFDALVDYGVEVGNPKAKALNRALRRETLIDLIGAAFRLPERTRQERIDHFILEYARQLTREDWLQMDREDVAMIEEQLAFVGER